ncbi:MAG: hypothetical protein V1875_02490 [Candidatus Altiarchaeota archaeon]
MEHDFRVTGKIPPQPPIPEWAKNKDTPGWLWLAAGGTVIGMIVTAAAISANILIAAAVILIRRRKKR